MNVGMSVFCDKSDFSQDNWEGRERAMGQWRGRGDALHGSAFLS